MSTTASQSAVLADRPKFTLFSAGMLLLGLGHLLTDLFSSTVPTLQPILGERFDLSLAQAGLLGGVFMFSSAVLQLPFGILSDRLHSRLFSVFGPLAAAIFLSSIGFASGFPMLLLLASLGGMGVAAFHPQSTKEASRLSGDRKGLGVALFITAGTFGLACGPLYFAWIISTFGFDRFYVAMTPAIIVCGLLLWKLPEPGAASAGLKRIDWQALGARWKPLSLHYALVVLRSVVQLGIGQFLTLYLTRERAYSMEDASLVLAAFFLAASTGSFAGGSLADRIGGKGVVVLSMTASSPFLAAFLLTDGILSLACLFAGGMILLLTIPVNVVMAQELVPSQAGTVTSLMMGFAWGVAGITFIPLIGWIGDHTGLQTVLWGVALAPLLGIWPALKLPRHG
jgi:FSR family fosmidomycin resistance protein-like MFS transporter